MQTEMIEPKVKESSNVPSDVEFQLAQQCMALIDAHWSAPNDEAKRRILRAMDLEITQKLNFHGQRS